MSEQKPTLISAEAGAIGSLLIAGEQIAGAFFQRLRPEDFLGSTNRHIFEAARALWLEEKPVDPVTVLARAGAEYEKTIASLMMSTPTAQNWEAYADLVRDQAELSRLRDVANAVLTAQRSEEAREALTKAQGMLAARENMRISGAKEMLNDFFDRMNDPTPTDFLDFGFPALNEQVHISQGRFVVLAADSSVGKTALALQMAYGLAMSGKRVGFFSLETSAADAMDRLMANMADVPLPAIKKKAMNDAAFKRCMDVSVKLAAKKLDLIEAAGKGVDDFRAVTLANRYDVIFVDYVQLVQTDQKETSDQVRAVSIGLHNMALQLGVTVIGLSQVTPPQRNQSGLRAELTKDNLRESRQLIQDAEAILILDLADQKDYSSNRIFKVDKNKDGPLCRMILRFEASRMRFSYVPPLEDSEEEASRERLEKMDRNREERQRKNRPDPGQASFRDLEDGGELPF